MKVVLYTLLFFSLKLASSRSEEVNSTNELKIAFNATTIKILKNEPQRASIGSRKCMDDLGCFEVTKDFFHPLHRPLNFLPHDRSSINTRFLLYTKEHPKEHHDLHVNNPEEIRNSHLDPAHRTLFIVHGFIDDRFYGKWMETLKDNVLLHSTHNVIIVDWSGGNGAPYTQSTANSRVVGAELAFFIERLQKLKGVSPLDCHIVGHSLGAHVAGYTGKRLSQLGRITGLDPAQPYFQYMPPTVRLDKTDANFVDVIHTDSGSHKFLPLGMTQAVGHVDFYPNNGMNQPGCTYSAIHSIFIEGLVDAARRFVACNHQRAVDFFTYSINYKRALPVAYQCSRWEDYLSGHCAECGRNNKRCAVMGFQADQYKPNKNDSYPVKMYLSTSSAAPFWEYSYQIKVKLRKPNVSFQDRKGDINLTLQGTKSNQGVKLTTKSGGLIHGATYTFLVRKNDPVGEIKGVNFSWISSSWNVFTTHTLHLDYVKIMPMNVNDDTEQRQRTKKFCETTGEAIKSKDIISLKNCK